MVLALIGATIAVAWWWRFFQAVTQFLTGAPGRVPLDCLYMRSGPCRMVSGVAEFLGYPAYDPLLLWGSGAVFIIGLILCISGTDNRDRDNCPHDMPRHEPRVW
jgi:hypothetical protein